MEAVIEEIESLIKAFKAHLPTQDELVEASSELTALFIKLSAHMISHDEAIRSKLIHRVVHNENLKAFVTCSIDSCFRTNDLSRAMNQFLYFLRHYKVFSSLHWYEKPLYIVFKMAARLLPKTVFAMCKKLVKKMTRDVIIPANYDTIGRHILTRLSQGHTINLNRLGEAILGEKEAEKRLSLILQDLQNPLIEVVSVKISSIYSQITPLSFDHSLNVLRKKLKVLFTACSHFYTLEKKQKFLYLDMEEYKDLFLTVRAFRETLSLPEFFSLSAGIALQSYIPDSLAVQEEITEWAATRTLQGGGAIKIRIVKGANLGMERVEASVKNWPQAPFKIKAEVDANFKKMVHYGIQHIDAVHIAIASHNVFDISYCLLLRAYYNLEDKISFEMLEGMCNHITQAVHTISKNTLLYCPTVADSEFHTAMAYLIRRLDENTQKENFLAHMFDIENDPLAFIDQKSRFERAVIEYPKLISFPRRQQDRRFFEGTQDHHAFSNTPDTDWTLAQNREFANSILKRWKKRTFDIPCIIGSGIIFTRDKAKGTDPSRPGLSLHTYSLASTSDIDTAIKYALADNSSWNIVTITERAQIFRRLAALLERQRGELICAIVAETAKPFSEADSEVSEAIDFANFYAHTMLQHEELFRLLPKQKDIALIATPWNFPCSIPVSSILAPLASGHTVIFKPAIEAILVGFKVVELLYQAGIPRENLQFITCQDDPVGTYLASHPAIGIIMTTGSTDTCRHFMKLKPHVRLFGETGGKNCAIVTRLADRDLAVRDIVQSAFGYAGQKCSALSLVIAEEEVYNDERFRQQLADAASSLPVGSAWDFTTKLNPLIRPPADKLLQAMTTLEPGEEWLLKPTIDKNNHHLITPGIKIGVQRKSFTHTTELFGPILGIMSAKNLNDAITSANMTPYGLTSGLFSLDPREHAIWKARIHAGNCYINRTITGAIVKRQPFGGCKASSFGIGMKAGGENYLLQLCNSFAGDFIDDPTMLQRVKSDFRGYIRQLKHADDQGFFLQAASSYVYWMQNHFSKILECDRLIGEDNYLKYLPHDHIFLYVQEEDSLADCLLVLAAARIANCPVTAAGLKTGMKTVSEDRFQHLIRKSSFPRFRALSKPPDPILAAWSEKAYCIDISRPKPHGRLELLHYLHEVTVSSSYHRYGNLLHREHEARNPTL